MSPRIEELRPIERIEGRKISRIFTYGMELLSIVPSFDKTITHRICSGLVGAHVVEVESCAGKSVLHMVDDRSLDGALVATNVGTHQLPHFLLPVGRGLTKLWSVEDTRFLVGLVASLSLA